MVGHTGHVYAAILGALLAVPTHSAPRFDGAVPFVKAAPA